MTFNFQSRTIGVERIETLGMSPERGWKNFEQEKVNGSGTGKENAKWK